MIPDFSSSHTTFLWWLDLIATTLSVMGSLWMIFSCIKKLSVPNLSLKIILAIAISDFCYSMGNVFTNFEKSDTVNLCHAEAYLRHYSFLFTIMLASLAAVIPHYNKHFEQRSSQNIFIAIFLVLAYLVAWFINSYT